MTPQVSLLLPVHNGGVHLPAALDSIKAQSFADFELLFVDDGSTDGSARVASRLWRGDERLQVFSPGRVGLVGALNLGLAAARAPLVARMDADDIAAPQRLEKQVAYLSEHPEVGICATQVGCFAADVLGEGYRHYEAWQNSLLEHGEILRELYVESPLAHPTVMMRTAIVRDLGGYRDRGWAEDYDLWLRAAQAGVGFGKVPQVLLQWRDHSERASRRQKVYSEDAFLRCKAHFLARGPLRGKRRVVIWGAGQVGRRLARYLLIEGAALLAFVDIDPRKVGRYRQQLPVHAAGELGQLAADFVIAAVGSRGARGLIRTRLVEMGFKEGESFLCAA